MSEHELPLTPEMRAAIAEQNTEALARNGLDPHIVAPWEDGFRTANEDDAFEWWYFDAQLEDGANVVVTFSSKPHTHPSGPMKPELLVIYRTAEGASTKHGVEFDVADFSANADKSGSCDVRIGPNWVRGDLASYDLHVETPEVTFDLHIDRVGPSWRPGAGFNYFDKDKSEYFAWVVPVPYGTLTGTITPTDGPATPIAGSAYHDHNWGNTVIGDMLDHWYWGRAHIGDYTVIYVQMTTAKFFHLGGFHMPVFYLAKGDTILTDMGLDMTLVPSSIVPGPGGQEYPNRIDIGWKNDKGDSVSLLITNPKLIQVLDMTDGMPAWKVHLTHLFADPLYYDFDADAELTVNIGDILEVVRGRTLFEKMMFR